MPEAADMFTAGAIAKELGVTDTKVKKAIKELAIEPCAKKGVCNYYAKGDVAKIRKALK